MTALLGELPALPLHEAGKYVAGAYVVAFALVLVYVAVMAMRLEATVDDLAGAIHAHPTLSEAVLEAAEGVHGMSVHI